MKLHTLYYLSIVTAHVKNELTIRYLSKDVRFFFFEPRFVFNIIILISNISLSVRFLRTNEIILYIIVIKGHFEGNRNVLRVRASFENWFCFVFRDL